MRPPRGHGPSEQRFPDLGAVVYPCSAPNGAREELPFLYSSLFATWDWFVTHDDPGTMGVCTLDDPRHVVFFHVAGDTVEVLNKAFPVAAPDVRRICAALFRAFPTARRIHLEVMWPETELGLPHRTLYSTDHMVIDLPATFDDYLATLGKRTRSHLRYYERRLRRDHPSLATEIVRPDAEAAALFELFLSWKTCRFHERDCSTYWDDDPRLAERFVALLRRCGEAHITSIAGVPAAIRFVFPVGTSICMQESAFDPRYEKYRLGSLTLSWVIKDAIARGATSVNLLWGTTGFKELLGATPRRATALSVFRTPSSRLMSLGEAGEVLRRRTRRSMQSRYWDARRSARRMLERPSGKSS